MSIDVNVQNDLVIVTESSEDIVVNVSNAAGPQGPAGANGVGVPVGGSTGQVLKKFTNTNYDTYWASDASGLTSIGLSMPSAFTVSNTPLTTNGTLAVTGAGTAAQYVRGDGALATFPTTASGGSSVNYYLNGSVASSVTGYKQMANTAVIGLGTDFNLVGNGLIAQFLTDAGNPNRVEIPGGAWNFEMYFSVSSSGGNQKFYVELLKYNGSTFTSIATGSTNPEEITGGTATDLYLTSLAVPTTSLLVTDRLAIRVYIVDNSIGRTITLHTEDNNLCEILTTFAGGISALNGLTANTQYLATGTSGTDFNISSTTDTHTFNIPDASSTARGLITAIAQTIAGTKTFTSAPKLTGLLIADGSLSTLSGHLGVGAATDGVIVKPSNGGTNNLYFQTGSFGYSYTYPANSGTLALTSDIPSLSGYVPATRTLTINGTTYDLSADRSWTVSGSATPAGSNTQIQYNNSGVFGASAGLVYDDSIGKMSLSKNHNGQTYLSISNTTAGSIANSGIAFTSNSGVNIAQINLTSTSTTPYKAVASGDLSIYKTNSGDITFQHDFGTGKIKFAMGGASTAQMTLTAAGRLLLGTTTEGSNLLDVNGGVNIVGGLIVDTNTLSVDAVNNRVGVGTSSPLAQLNINQLSGTTKGIFISGDEIYASGNGAASSGVRIGLGVSRTSNRQLWMGDNDAFGSSTLSIFRYQTGITGYAGLDAVTGDGLTRLTTILGSDTSKVGVGYNDAGFITIGSYTAKLNVFTSGTETTTNLLIKKFNTASGLYLDVQDAVGSSKLVLTNAGRLLLGTTTESTFLLDVNGTARVSGKLSVNTPTATSAVFEVTSTTQGALFPRMTTTEKNAIASPATGLQVYDTTLGSLNVYNGSSWVALGAAGSGGMAIGGAITSATAGSVLFATTGGVLGQNNANFFWDNTNARLGIGITAPLTGIHVLGEITVKNTNNNNLIFSNKFQNNCFVTSSISNITSSATFNTAIGMESMSLLTTGQGNTAVGYQSSVYMTTGGSNSAFGFYALRQNVSGSTNVAIGRQSLENNLASNNTAVGALACRTNTTGINLAAVGASALEFTTGNNNTALGYLAGSANTTGANNIFIGASSAGVAITDSNRTFIGNSSTTSTWLGGNLLLGSTTDNGARLQVTGKLTLSAGTTGASQINLASSTAPTTPNNGDIWFDGTNIKMQIGGVTKTFTLI